MIVYQREPDIYLASFLKIRKKQKKHLPTSDTRVVKKSKNTTKSIVY